MLRGLLCVVVISSWSILGCGGEPSDDDGVVLDEDQESEGTRTAFAATDRCWVGASPKVRVACQKVFCHYPAPYDGFGGTPLDECTTKARCLKLAKKCGVPADKVFFANPMTQVINTSSQTATCALLCQWKW